MFSRGQNFLRVGMEQYLEHPTQELSVGLNYSYKETLIMHHGFLTRNAPPVGTIHM